MLEKELTADEEALKSVRQSEIDVLLESIANEKESQADATVWEDVIVAKKEAVGLQLEAAYRQRLQDAYVQVIQKGTMYEWK